MKTISFVLIVLLSILSNPLLAQSCNSKIKAATPDARFHDNQNGTVTDKLTGLQWAHCSLGLRFRNPQCGMPGLEVRMGVRTAADPVRRRHRFLPFPRGT